MSYAQQSTRQASDVVSIVVGSMSLSGWQDVRVTRSLETFPSHFSIGLTERYPTQANSIVIKPGDPITLKLGDDTVLTGYVDDYETAMGPNQHDVRITGRSKCLDLLDCSAGESPYQLNNTTLVSLAKNLAQPFGVTVSAPDGDSSVIPQHSVTLTESPFEVLEPIAQWANFILHDDTDGNLVICRVGESNAASGFVQGMNVQSASLKYSMQSRFTEIEAIFLSTGFLLDPPPAPGSSGPVIPFVPGAQAIDKSFPKRADGSPRFRRLLIVCAQTTNTTTLAAQCAQWEMSRRIGRSQAVTITCDSWRDAAGQLWAPNTLAPIELPALKLTGKTWLIAQVTFVRGDGGTTAQLVLMPKEAFIPQPQNLVPFDANISNALPGGGTSQAPAPR